MSLLRVMIRTKGCAGCRNNRGIALISVLWSMLALSVIALSMISIAGTQSRLAANLLESAQETAIADAGIHLMIQKLTARNAAEEVPAKVAEFSLAYREHVIDVRLVPESGKIDINTAALSLISALLSHHGVGDGEVQSIVRAMARKRLEPGNMRIASVGEFVAEFDLARRLTPCLQPYVTVYSNLNGVDVAAAGEPVKELLAWGIRAGWADAGWPSSADLRTQRESGPTRHATGAHSGKVFTVTASVASESKETVRRTAVIRVTGNPAEPFWIYGWQRSFAEAGGDCNG